MPLSADPPFPHLQVLLFASYTYFIISIRAKNDTREILVPDISTSQVLMNTVPKSDELKYNRTTYFKHEMTEARENAERCGGKRCWMARTEAFVRLAYIAPLASCVRPCCFPSSTGSGLSVLALDSFVPQVYSSTLPWSGRRCEHLGCTIVVYWLYPFAFFGNF